MFVLSVLVLSVAQFSGCMYDKVIFPLDRDVDQTRLGAKTGRASAYSIAWLVSWGDAGTAKAAENGGMQIINHLDGEYFIVLGGLWKQQIVCVCGE